MSIAVFRHKFASRTPSAAARAAPALRLPAFINPTVLAQRPHGARSLSFRPNGTYRRFNSDGSPFWQSRRFWVRAQVIGALGTGYYVYHLEDSPTGRRQFINVSPATEAKAGLQSYRAVMAQYGRQLMARGTPADMHVRRVAHRVIQATGMQTDWEVHVIDSPERNAFVLPGGKIFVFSGILALTQTEDGLATVLAHEIAHQYARHPAEQISRGTLFSFVLLLASFFVDPSMADLGRVTGRLLLELPNSRACEREADHLGLLFMAAACYDPNEAVAFWQRMRAAEETAPPQFLSTHPSSASRVDGIRDLLPQAQMKRDAANCPTPELTSSFFSALNSNRWT
ncbi:peptidase family M48-domain-containing protein [Coemansia spiralis]|nr:peptidase family M48-domain-containing protein [Coemansia spiralis]